MAQRPRLAKMAANPNDFDSNLELGQILVQRKHCAEALPYAKRAVLVRPKSFEARYALALCYECSANAGDARREFETLADSAPDAPSPHAGLARLYDQLHMSDDAERERHIAARLNAVSPRATNKNDGAYDLLPIGSLAPDFTLRRSGPAAQLRLSSLLGPKPTVLIFGSYSCQKFRFDAPALESLYERYQRHAQFLLVYVHEAHTEESWQSSVNQREGIEVPAAKTLQQKETNAATCARKLDLKFPVLIDGMDRHVESSYAGWPSAIYILGKDGHIVWRSRLGEQELSVSELERVMGELTSSR
jgi:tetratricopeptide (TPR) repeat protein